MDTRRLLTLAAASGLLAGCAGLRTNPTALEMTEASPAATEPIVVENDGASAVASPIASPSDTERPYLLVASQSPAPDRAAASAVSVAAVTGPRAIAAANVASRAPSRDDAFMGGVQVFAWSPGRVFEIWTAPLRVTTLSLGPGETLVAKAAGDTVRWQIGEAVSGAGETQRTHILLKPLQRGLETNLVLTTNRRVYLLELRSGSAESFNAAVTWDIDIATSDAASPTPPPVLEPETVAMPVGPLDGSYRIEPRGRKPRWTPTSVFNDGRRTFITFDPDLQVDEAPALFVIGADGEPQLVNYRQVGGLLVVDRLFDRAELRLGDRRPQVVRIERTAGGRS